MNSSQWFMRRRFLNVFAKKTYIKLLHLGVWPFVAPEISFEQ